MAWHRCQRRADRAADAAGPRRAWTRLGRGALRRAQPRTGPLQRHGSHGASRSSPGARSGASRRSPPSPRCPGRPPRLGPTRWEPPRRCGSTGSSGGAPASRARQPALRLPPVAPASRRAGLARGPGGERRGAGPSQGAPALRGAGGPGEGPDRRARRGLARRPIPVMGEFPADVFRAAERARRLDGFAIGSNDLPPPALGIGPDREALAPLLSGSNLAALRMIVTLVARERPASGRVSAPRGRAKASSSCPSGSRRAAAPISVTSDGFGAVERHRAEAACRGTPDHRPRPGQPSGRGPADRWR